MFDRTKPYGTVHGLFGVKYDQGGKLYNVNEDLVDNGGGVTQSKGQLMEAAAATLVEAAQQELAKEAGSGEAATEPAKTEEPPVEEPVTTEKTPVEEPATEPAKVEEPDLQEMPWREIKARVIAAGGTWVNKEKGIAYLRSL